VSTNFSYCTYTTSGVRIHLIPCVTSVKLQTISESKARLMDIRDIRHSLVKGSLYECNTLKKLSQCDDIN